MIAASCPKKKTTKEGKEEIEEATASSAAVMVFFCQAFLILAFFSVSCTYTHSSLCSCGHVAVSSDGQKC